MHTLQRYMRGSGSADYGIRVPRARVWRCFKVRIWLPGALVVESSDDVGLGDTVAVLTWLS